MACGEARDKRDLVRVVRFKTGETPEGENTYDVCLDLTGKKPGRGAYICRSAQCLEKVRKSGRLEKSLEVKIPAEIYDKMAQELKGDE